MAIWTRPSDEVDEAKTTDDGGTKKNLLNWSNDEYYQVSVNIGYCIDVL